MLARSSEDGHPGRYPLCSPWLPNWGCYCCFGLEHVFWPYYSRPLFCSIGFLKHIQAPSHLFVHLQLSRLLAFCSHLLLEDSFLLCHFQLIGHRT